MISALGAEIIPARLVATLLGQNVVAFCRAGGLLSDSPQPQIKKPGTKAGLFNLAVREGFEPSIGINLYTLSRRAPSTTRTPHQILFSSLFVTVGIDDNGLWPLSPLRGFVATLLVQNAVAFCRTLDRD